MRTATPMHARLIVALVTLGASVVSFAACRIPPQSGTTTTTSAVIPRPDAIGTTKRTIDNTGFVDNGGRTSDETNRTVASGMRATETGSERPTGTPGSGLPLPIEPSPPPAAIGEGAGAAQSVRGAEGPPRGGVPIAESAVSRITRARCDLATSCDHVGEGKPYRTAVDCMMQERQRTMDEIDGAACPNGIDAVQLANCLADVRRQACTAPSSNLDALVGCQSSALCAPP
jgi:hypothetical protein